MAKDSFIFRQKCVMKSVLANHIVFFQAFLDMGEEVLVGGAEKGLVAEVAGGQKAVMQAAAVADVVPAAVLAAAGGDVLGAFVGLGLFDAGQDVGEGLTVQVAVGVLLPHLVALALELLAHLLLLLPEGLRIHLRGGGTSHQQSQK